MIYDIIYEKFYRVIVNYSFCRIKDKYYAEEIANDTFALLWERWDSMNFSAENALLSWLYKVAENKIQEHKRKKLYDYIPLENNYIAIPHENGSSYYEELDPMQEEQKYLAYMAELKDRLLDDDLKLFERIIIQKLPYLQIAKDLDTTVPAVKMRWYRLKSRLRKIVQDITGENVNKL